MAISDLIGRVRESGRQSAIELVGPIALVVLLQGETGMQIAECSFRTLAIVDRFPILLMVNRLHAADLILPPPAEDSAAVKKRIAAARKHQRPNGPDSNTISKPG